MKKNKGFSLTEIVVTIVIIVVLSTISGPIYNSYSVKTKQAEGILLLGTIKDAQMKWYNDNGCFWGQYSSNGTNSSSATAFNTTLGIDSRPNKYYKTFRANTNRKDIGGKTFCAVVYSDEAKNLSMICPEDGPTTIL